MAPATEISTSLAVRRVRPDDRARIEAAVAYTSPDTYYRRFHAYKRGFSRRELEYLTELDGHDHVALIATERDRPDRLVAIARFVRYAHDPTVAELAVTVHDPYQRLGIGRYMLTLLVAAAQAEGVTCLRALIQADNRAMIELMRRVLPQTVLERRDGATVEYAARIDS